jgi:predicted house-cleaning noncanonical NTP pyrophosphatase (MazG superfamily)
MIVHEQTCGEEVTIQAQQIIHEIGENGQSELEKTIYSNKENVHMLNDSFKTFIEKCHTKYVGKLMKIVDICEFIEDLATQLNISEDSIFKIRQSLDRIMLEPTLHTARKIPTSDIFRLIKYLIDNHPSKEQLQIRLLEELEDMANTCSSGHAKRLVNVMVGFTDELEGSIDIKDQFIANIKARIMATIRHLTDDDLRDSLLESMASTGDEKLLFNNHVKAVCVNIEKELCEEFVTEGWLSEKKFNVIFKETVSKLLVN